MTMDDLRHASMAALCAHDELLNVWRKIEESQLSQEASSDDVAMLRELIIRRIYPVSAFGLLVRIDPTAAVQVLLSRYLGLSVDPDAKFGGFEFELETMLDDLNEVGGNILIEQLVRHPQFAVERITDPRVCRAFSEVLQIEEEQFPIWIAHRRKTIQ